MLGRTDPPRDDLTAEQVDALLNGDRLAPTYGLDLLVDGAWVDISDDLVSWTVDRDNFPANGVHGGLKVSVQRELSWGRDRVRPWVELTAQDGSYSARFDRGVYVVTTSTEPSGESPVTWEADGFDLLHLLRRSGPLDAYGFESTTTTYFAALAQIVADSGVGVQLLLDGTSQAVTLP